MVSLKMNREKLHFRSSSRCGLNAALVRGGRLWGELSFIHTDMHPSFSNKTLSIMDLSGKEPVEIACKGEAKPGR